MALTKGTNSYVELSEADLYLDDRLDNAQWLAAVGDTQDQALVTAFHALDNLAWKGYTTNEDQATAWPRSGTYYDRSRGRSVTFDSTATEAPERIRNAQIELAFHYVVNSGITLDTGSVATIDVGSVTLEQVRTPSKIPPAVKRLIAPLLSEASTGITRIN